MSILIRGIEMPKEGFIEIIIMDDGTVQQTGQSYRIDGTDYYTPYVGEMPTMFEAVEVPPHGRLIDANALFEEIYKAWGFTADASDCSVLMQLINDAPTIIPADKEGT